MFGHFTTLSMKGLIGENMADLIVDGEQQNASSIN